MMKQLCLSIFILLASPVVLNGQFLSLPDLVNLCSVDDLEAAGAKLSEKSWGLMESETDGEEGMKSDVWSYGTSYTEYYDEYSAMAPGYLNLISREGNVTGLYYTVFEFDLYNRIFNSIKENGFKKLRSKEFKDEDITAYSDGDLILLFDVSTIDDEEDPEASYTAYMVYLFRRADANSPGESGPRKEYYDTGELRAEYVMRSGRPEGRVQIYDRTGFIVQDSYYKDGELHGERRFYFPSVDQNTGLPIDESGQLYLVSKYSRGEPHGREMWYFQMKYETFPCEITDTAGVVSPDTCRKLVITRGKEEINYHQGVLHGLYELYDEDGALVVRGKYKKGVETGKWFRKPEDGQPSDLN